MLDYATLMRADVVTDLRTQQQADKVIALILGDYATTFIGFDMFMYIDNSLAEDNGETVFKPNILTEEQSGRWHKINPIPTTISPSGASTRDLNDPFIVSAEHYSVVLYTLSATTEVSLSGGETAQIVLELSEDGSTNWMPVSAHASGISGTLIVGVSIATPATGMVGAIVPPGYSLRLNTTGTTSGVTITLVTQQENIIG